MTKCTSCGSSLSYVPGTQELRCDHCGAVNKIAAAAMTDIEETDFGRFLSDHADERQMQEVNTVTCSGCGATTTLKPNVTADTCPFCGTALVISSGSSSKLIKPGYILPLKVTRPEATDAFRKWIRGLWFAPNDLKKAANNADTMNGVYLPYWAYHAHTSSKYAGERGIYYYTPKTYTTTENGQSVVKTEQIKEINWTPVSGTVTRDFDNILVLASRSLPDAFTRKLEPWDLSHLINFDEDYLAGFRSEAYLLDVRSGFESAKKLMAQGITQSVNQQIGGDQRKLYSVNTSYEQVSFKHILLPIWISAYRYNGKPYRFLVNGRTGDVHGERPYSALKIALCVIVVIALIAACILAR